MLTKLKFAIVEDNPDYANVVGWMINGNIKIFKEVSEFKDEGFDCVFCDLRLKETYGLDTIKALREKTCKPIIVLTGMGAGFLGATDFQAFLDAGADEVYRKEIITDPTFPDMVLKIIEKHNRCSI